MALINFAKHNYTLYSYTPIHGSPGVSSLGTSLIDTVGKYWGVDGQGILYKATSTDGSAFVAFTGNNAGTSSNVWQDILSSDGVDSLYLLTLDKANIAIISNAAASWSPTLVSLSTYSFGTGKIVTQPAANYAGNQFIFGYSNTAGDIRLGFLSNSTGTNHGAQSGWNAYPAYNPINLFGGTWSSVSILSSEFYANPNGQFFMTYISVSGSTNSYSVGAITSISAANTSTVPTITSVLYTWDGYGATATSNPLGTLSQIGFFTSTTGWIEVFPSGSVANVYYATFDLTNKNIITGALFSSRNPSSTYTFYDAYSRVLVRLSNGNPIVEASGFNTTTSQYGISRVFKVNI
jgi:hypothetical protein